MKKLEYALMAVTTKKVFPRVYSTKEEAEKNRMKHAEPDHWEIVAREVTYGNWKNIENKSDKEITVEELLHRYIPIKKGFDFMTPSGFVNFTSKEAEKILAGEMKPNGTPGDPDYSMSIETKELLEFKCKENDINDAEDIVYVLVY